MTGRLATRRQWLLLAATAIGAFLPGRRAHAGPGDHGIGGTGFSLRPADEESDRGIGGTGVIGTIRKFGSIIVNDLRISYPSDVTVRIDGEAATAGDLRIGQVVRVAAQRSDEGGLSTHLIDVTHEVVGPVERLHPSGLVVLGQTVSTSGLKAARKWTVGDRVAVSGLRRNDGTIMASLITASGLSVDRVAGPVRQSEDGALRIGGLHVSGLSGSMIGRRMIVEGSVDGTRLVVAHSASEESLLPKDVRTISVEAYVERRGADASLGSGLKLDGLSTVALPAGRSLRAVITTSVSKSGRIKVDSVKAGGRSYRAAAVAPPESRPMDFGSSPPASTTGPNGSLDNGPEPSLFGRGGFGPGLGGGPGPGLGGPGGPGPGPGGPGPGGRR